MNLKRNFALILALGALLLVGSNCTLIYSGCESDSECNTEAGERCITGSGGSGECGLPQSYCEEGATMRCEDAAYPPGELEAAEMEGREPVALGVCADKVQICGTDGAFQACIVEEICNGLDDDCNMIADDGVEGVGEVCAVGDGACRSEGATICQADGTQTCSAAPAAPTAPSCDCSDNNCDTVINDFVLSTASAPSAPAVPQADWEYTMLSGQRYAAIDNGTGVDVIALDGDGATLATISGASAPRIFASHTAGTLVVFYTAQADNELMLPQAEVHRITIDPLTGTAGEALCVGCADARRGEKGGVTAFDVAFAGVDSNLDGVNDPTDENCTDNACGYVTTYVRETGQVFSARVDALTLDLTANSEGIVLSFMEGNNNLVDVQIEISNPSGLAYLGLMRTDNGVSTITLASVLATNRVQVDASSVVVDSFDRTTQDFDFDVLPNGDVLVAVSNPTSVEVQRYFRQETTKSFEPVFDAPVVITPNTTGTAIENPQVSWICIDEEDGTDGEAGAESAFVAFEVVADTGERVIEAATVERNQGLVSLHPPGTVAGTLPVVERLEEQLVVGALVAAEPGGTVDGATTVTPSVDPLTCDP